MLILLACVTPPAAYIAPKDGVDPPPSVVEPPPGEPTSQSSEAGAETSSTTAGADPATQVGPTVKTYRYAIHGCVQRALRHAPKLHGRVTVGWTITAGTVSDVKLVSNETGNAPLGTCIVGAVERFRFPADVTGTVPSYTWILSGE